MKLDIQSIHFDADHKLLEYIQKKVDKLDTFYDGIVDAIIFLRLENNDQQENKTVELKVNVSNSTLFSKEKGTSFESATDIAVEALKAQLKKYKDKLRSK
jgi:putative sigma-54 modulation protein